MYLTIEDTAKYLDLQTSDIMRLIREKQIRYIVVNDDILINQNQFNFFIEQRQKALKDYQDYLNTPLTEDIDVKDED